MTSLARFLAVMFAAAALSGCAAISALTDASTPLEVYELRSPVDITPRQGRTLPLDVIVELPTSSGTLETDRIMIRPNALQAQYLPEVRWSDATPVMVQNLMLRAVEATSAVRYVGRKPLGLSGDYAVVTELLDFHAEVGADGETAVIQQRMIVRLVRERDASIVASRTFKASAVSPTLDTPDLVAAFDVASNQLFTQFADWIVTALSAR
ncbi:cholesterol transport system auxiliary component [Cognatiyoonia koreensis]|uniref:Cholesterol transport system auxiliary component n=1 Tax=Cognatiyoonia koreensis TaxID=364200 RepID=A0A1I0QTZ7_9RHOB|nr:ABC-type transport auxiliary lipoprotein family protein [Cognatiyoonia koreensis]SEW30871.1 cholesterol transport system auxiliary component [Cognatiyoonia koreensis]